MNSLLYLDGLLKKLRSIEKIEIRGQVFVGFDGPCDKKTSTGNMPGCVNCACEEVLTPIVVAVPHRGG